MKILFKRLVPEVLAHRPMFFGAVLFGVAVSALKGVTPEIMRRLTDEAWTSGNSELAIQLPLILAGIWILQSVFRYFHMFWMKYISDLVAVSLRKKLMDKYLSMNLAFLHGLDHGSAGLISRMMNDITVIQNGIYKMADFMREPFLVVFSLGYVVYLDWRLTLFILVALPLVIWANRALAKSLRRHGHRSQVTMEELTKTLKESLDGSRVVQSFNLQEEMKRKFDREADEYLLARRKINSREEVSGPISETLAVMGLAALLIYIGREIFAGHLVIADVMSFIVAVGFLSDSVRKLQEAYIKLQQATVGLERLNEIFNFESALGEALRPRAFPEDWKEIEFKNVSFQYSGGEPVLRNINFKVQRGQVIALVGPSGGGKSTLVNLLERFYDPTIGRVCIGGVDLRDMGLRDLRSHIALVTQDVFLFGETIEKNILFGRQEKGAEGVLRAAQAANAHDFILETPKGYQSRLGELGNNLSGGQKQRISIARALFKDAPILILDEATSALDSESEKEVQKGLEELMKGRTVFVIAHRLSTVQKADRILVIKNGEIVEEGSHSDLLSSRGEYFNFHELQKT